MTTNQTGALPYAERVRVEVTIAGRTYVTEIASRNPDEPEVRVRIGLILTHDDTGPVVAAEPFGPSSRAMVGQLCALEMLADGGELRTVAPPC